MWCVILNKYFGVIKKMATEQFAFKNQEEFNNSKAASNVFRYAMPPPSQGFVKEGRRRKKEKQKSIKSMFSLSREDLQLL